MIPDGDIRYYSHKSSHAFLHIANGLHPLYLYTFVLLRVPHCYLAYCSQVGMIFMAYGAVNVAEFIIACSKSDFDPVITYRCSSWSEIETNFKVQS